MGTGEESTPAKPSKPSSAQEIPPTPAYPDWSNSMQAYYGAGATPPFFASTVPSPTPHPYLWGGQHPLMPPYGTPVPYPALYPAGGVYAHPNMATPPNPAQANTEYEGKGPDGREKASVKKSKGNVVGKAGESAKATSGSGNDGASQSAESGSDGSSDASDENNNHQDFAANKKGSFDQMLADANAQNNTAGASVPGKPVVSMPATNLNIGMDLWNASPAAAPGATKIRPNASGGSSGIVPAIMPEQWIQDERELKRQKRKQSNRESARRSRLRKQAECEELQARVETLTTDNRNLRDELQRLSEECDKLKSENDSIKEELTRLYGPDAVANLEQSNHSSVVQFRGDEGNS
ncbi:G-box-binding factor 1 [Ricinus communis]|uniref:G-box-binding factor, putative n=1 Tax=Ricinus communis TaxID=3988 RepID=B9SGI7_RICCO|nr:G-box-binding factor 1 [Ricinus communis]XP_015578442.1 G-box-binding factor 1 [Ricinus communis]XP_025014196.1 G-box-binding factor 1 [Ricinus communis]XP_048232402.1 G-box-binding factor 1 [Ricinus communis]XP_048232403.1 G-box-binding factor 1 [Ricinus communis]EEF37233.1 G-box-binding factor, putative [Ricinus communis]|eukprot:XP_002525106.1 G-box-binding factor 1 [Ricinus communis]